MVTLNAHFDGKTIVIDGPCAPPIPPGARLRIHVELVEDSTHAEAEGRGRFVPFDIRLDPQLSHAIALDPEFGVGEE